MRSGPGADAGQQPFSSRFRLLQFEVVQQTLLNPEAQSRDALSDRAAGFAAGTCRRAAIPRILRLWHLTSLDAPTVAVMWSMAFAWSARVQLGSWIPALQALAVWVVYVGDRLLDVRGAMGTLGEQALRERHFFHWRHRRVLLPLAAVAGCAVAWMVFFAIIPLATRERDSVLAAAGLVYFACVHAAPGDRKLTWRLPQTLFSKEMLVGISFAAGCAVPTLAHMPSKPMLPLVAYFAALAWLNCHAIERWESGFEPTGMPVIARAVVVAVVGLAMAAVMAAAFGPRPAALLAAGAASALLLAGLDRTRKRLAPVTLRAAADLVLLTPALLLLLPWMR